MNDVEVLQQWLIECKDYPQIVYVDVRFDAHSNGFDSAETIKQDHEWGRPGAAADYCELADSYARGRMVPLVQFWLGAYDTDGKRVDLLPFMQRGALARPEIPLDIEALLEPVRHDGPLPPEMFGLEFGGIYFVQVGLADDAPIKIGEAANIRERLSGLQTAHPWPLRLLQFEIIADDVARRAREAVLHKRFAHLNMRGEWFRFDVSILRKVR